MIKELTLSRFTPSLLSHQALEAIFVRREALAERLVQSIRESATTGNKHFFLLHGPRGIGKTHIVSLVYWRVKQDAELSDRLCVAWLREEEWGVASYIDLLRSVLRALHEEYGDKELAQANEDLVKLTVEEAEFEAEKLLLQSVGGRTLLILTENIDEIFAGLEDEGQKKLRALIQNNPVFTILATARGLFNGVEQRQSPFYGFFDIHALDEFTSDDATNLLSKIAQQGEDHKLAALLGTRQGHARVRALHYLAGGNPRVYVIFSQFLTRESLDALVTAVMNTLDDLTSYYQERMARLTPQQRKIVQFLCDQRGAPTVKVIADSNFITHQTASSQLKKLRELGYVRSEQRGRESYYELKEPLMRIALGVKKHRGEPLYLLVEFLRLWYTHKELHQRLEMLKPEAALERTYLTHAIRAKEEETEDPLIAACLGDYATRIEAEDFEGALCVVDELIDLRNFASDWVDRAACLQMLGREDDAAESRRRVLEIKPKTALQWYDLGDVLLDRNSFEEALIAFDKALEREAEYVDAWNSRGIALAHLEQIEEALQAFEKALEFDPRCATAWSNRGDALGELDRNAEALDAYEKALGVDSNDTRFLKKRGFTLGILERYDEALQAFEKALEIDPDDVGAWNNRGVALTKLDRHSEALDAYKMALETRPNDTLAQKNLGFALTRLNLHAEALQVYEKLLEAERDDPDVWNNQGFVLAKLERYNEAIEAYDMALAIRPGNAVSWKNRGVALAYLNRHAEALQAFSKALDLNPNSTNTWNSRGFALAELDRYAEALAAFEKSIEIDPKNAYAWNNKSAALADLNRHDEALEACEIALKLNPDNVTLWKNQGDTLVHLGRYDEALAAFDKSLLLDPTNVDSDLLPNRAVTLMLLGRWEAGRKQLDRVLKNLTESIDGSLTEFVMVRDLLERTQDMAMWHKLIALWIELFGNRKLLPCLGQSLVRSIRTFKISRLDQNAARAWYEVWQDLVGNHKEMELPLRLLRTAVEYHAEKDDRVLFQLPIEERKLLEPLLGIGQ